jgi:hypothetical protein
MIILENIIEYYNVQAEKGNYILNFTLKNINNNNNFEMNIDEETQIIHKQLSNLENILLNSLNHLLYILFL